MKKILFACFTLMVPQLHAEEATVTLHSTVSGNRELPKVMYIVPWQPPGAAQLSYELQDTLASELFVPIDRDEFVRGLVYQTVAKRSVQSLRQASEDKISANADAITIEINTTD